MDHLVVDVEKSKKSRQVRYIEWGGEVTFSTLVLLYISLFNLFHANLSRLS